MNPFKKPEPQEYSKLIQDLDFAMKTQEFSSSMATEKLDQAVMAARAFTNVLADIPTDQRVHITLQYKIDIY